MNESDIKQRDIMDEAYQYVKDKIKDRKMTQEKLAHKLYSDRITIYRRLKNLLPITADFKESLYAALALKPAEIDELETLFLRMEFGEETISLYKEIDRVFFEFTPPTINPFHLQCHTGGEVYYYRSETLFDEIFADINKPNFRCETTIINCMDKGVISSLSRFLTEISKLGDRCQTNHYINLLDSNLNRLFDIFSNLAFVLPLFHMENYSIFVNTDSKTQQNMFFDNSVICTVSHNGDAKKYKHYWFVISQEAIPSCLTFTDEACFTFIRHNIDVYIKQFNSLLFRTASEESLLREFMERQPKAPEIMLIKPDPCYDMIPPHVYQSLKERCLNSLDSKGVLFLANSFPRMDLRNAMDHIINMEKTRYELTFKQKRIDVFSASGLRQFALSGRLTDHIDGIPPFSEEEVVQILQNLYDRVKDPHDPYTLYITRKEMLNDQFILDLSANWGIFIEPLFTRKGYHFKYLHINHKILSDLFFQYLNNWLFPRYTMTLNESLEFLSRLQIEAAKRIA